jgi:hypothetical protein
MSVDLPTSQSTPSAQHVHTRTDKLTRSHAHTSHTHTHTADSAQVTAPFAHHHVCSARAFNHAHTQPASHVTLSLAATIVILHHHHSPPPRRALMHSSNSRVCCVHKGIQTNIHVAGCKKSHCHTPLRVCPTIFTPFTLLSFVGGREGSRQRLAPRAFAFLCPITIASNKCKHSCTRCGHGQTISVRISQILLA